MEIKNNQLTIDIPKGMEIDVENSDLTKGLVKFKEKEINYIDVCIALNTADKSIIVSDNNYKKIKAISQLIDIAEYYNKDWRPDWKYRETKHYIYFDNISNEYDINYDNTSCRSTIYFKNSKDAKAVINNPNFREILDTIYKN